MSLIAPFLVVFSLLLSSHSIDAMEPAHAKAELLSFVKNPKKGETFWVALTLEGEKGWHTYWENPGDSGLKTTMNWDLPKGISIVQNLSTMPTRHIQEDVTTYVYEKIAVHFVQLKIAEDFQGLSVPIKLNANWLVCSDACVPESKELSLTLELGKSGEADILLHKDLFNNWMKEVPQIIKEPISIQSDSKSLILILPQSVIHLTPEDVNQIYFIPRENIGICYKDKPTFEIKDQETYVTVPLDMVAEINKNPEYISGLILVEGKDGSQKAFDISSKNTAARSMLEESVLMVLLFAFLGGVILNAMPCVFPILSLKALSIVQTKASENKKNAIVYTLGIVISFIILGLIVIVMKEGGTALGWGFQMQSPTFVMLMIYLLFLIGLNLSGFFEITITLGDTGQTLTEGSHLKASFFTGVLATAVATPCTAPFMATAVSYALSSSSIVLLSIMISLGVGLAAPFLLISFVPVFQRFLPKPGMWMVTLKQLLAFPMYASVLWLVWVIVQQTGSRGLLLSGTGILLCAFSVWLWTTLSLEKLIARFIVALALISITVYPIVLLEHKQDTSIMQKESSTPYSKDLLNKYVQDKKPVFVYATAAWCITCKFNEIILNSAEVEKDFKDHGIDVLVADWTNSDPEITRFLDKFGRKGVPLYVYFPKEGTPIILPQILTKDMILSLTQ